jgi:hypothetical protein
MGTTGTIGIIGTIAIGCTGGAITSKGVLYQGTLTVQNQTAIEAVPESVQMPGVRPDGVSLMADVIR